MKLTLILFLTTIFVSCGDTLSQNGLSDENFLIKELESVDAEPWKSGNYIYELNPESLESVKELLNELDDKGVEVETSWYNEGASSCGMTGAVVPSELILKVREVYFEGMDPSDLNEFNQIFDALDVNTAFWCPIKVYEITPK